jgi:hypothetical protein
MFSFSFFHRPTFWFNMDESEAIITGVTICEEGASEMPSPEIFSGWFGMKPPDNSGVS